MTRWLRRIVVLSLLGGTADLVRRKLKRADEIKPSDYRPFVPVIPPPVAKATPVVEAPEVEAPAVKAPAPVETTAASESIVASDWVEPVDGVCPVSHPIKGNDQSKIFHVPGGASYERTVPERCYVSAAAAEADGYRPSKR
jgi:hypothetical protein